MKDKEKETKEGKKREKSTDNQTNKYTKITILAWSYD